MCAPVEREQPIAVSSRRLLARRDDQVLPALSLVGPHLAHHTELALPEVAHATRGRPGRELDHQWPGLAEIDEVEDVRRRRVRRDQAEPILDSSRSGRDRSWLLRRRPDARGATSHTRRAEAPTGRPASPSGSRARRRREPRPRDGAARHPSLPGPDGPEAPAATRRLLLARANHAMHGRSQHAEAGASPIRCEQRRLHHVAGVRPCLRMTAPSAARSGGPPTAASRTLPISRK